MIPQVAVGVKRAAQGEPNPPAARVDPKRGLWYHALREEVAMPKADAHLIQRLQQSPDGDFHLILRVSGDVADVAERLRATPVEVRHALRLIGAVAVRAQGKEALRLLDEPWLVRMEEDRPVHALS